MGQKPTNTEAKSRMATGFAGPRRTPTMADLSLEFAAEQGLGKVLGHVRLQGDLSLPDGGRARASLLLSKTGVWLVAARTRSIGLKVDLLTRGDLRLESGRVRDRLCFGGEALTIPNGRRGAVERLIALGRLSPNGRGLGLPLKTSRMIRTPDELGRAWLERELGLDEIVICWLRGSNTTLLDSQLLGSVQSRPHLFVTDRRAAIVAWSNVADVTYATLTTDGVQALARDQKTELIAPNASFLSHRADAGATRDAFDLIALTEPKARLLEAARRIWIDREQDHEAGFPSLDLLHAAIERGSERARYARLLLIAEQSQSSTEMAEAELTRALAGGRLTPDALAELWESWEFSAISGNALVTRLIDVGALPFALALKRRIHELPGIDDEVARDELRLAAFAVNARLAGATRASTRDRALQALLDVHGLREPDADLARALPATEELTPQLIEGILSHPLTRTHGSLVEGVQKLIALAPEPDQVALSDYCEALNENEQPRATRALSVARRAFALPTLHAYVSRGKKSIGLRGYEGKTPYILLGSAHLDAGSPYYMSERELQFAFGAEALHLKLGHTRLTSSDVWAGAFSHTKDGIELLLGLLPLVKGIPLGDGIGKLIERIPEPALRRALEVVLRFERGRRKTASSSSSAPRGALSLVNENLFAAQRLLQMSADRAGLVLCGSLRAGVRGLLLSRPDYLELLQAMEQRGIVQVLASDEVPAKMRADLIVRVAALLDFYTGDDYLTLRRASCESRAEEEEL